MSRRQGITGSAKAQEQLRAAEKLAVSQRDADLQAVMNLPAGRRFLWDLIDRRCNAHGTGYSASGSEMYFLAGQRDIGVALRLDLQRLDHKLYAQMMVEAITDAEEARLRQHSAAGKVDPLEADDDDT